MQVTRRTAIKATAAAMAGLITVPVAPKVDRYALIQRFCERDKDTRYPGLCSPVVFDGEAYATNSRIMAAIEYRGENTADMAKIPGNIQQAWRVFSGGLDRGWVPLTTRPFASPSGVYSGCPVCRELPSCQLCDGEGEYFSLDGPAKCPRCNGIGREQFQGCDICGGKIYSVLGEEMQCGERIDAMWLNRVRSLGEAEVRVHCFPQNALTKYPVRHSIDRVLLWRSESGIVGAIAPIY